MALCDRSAVAAQPARGSVRCLSGFQDLACTRRNSRAQTATDRWKELRSGPQHQDGPGRTLRSRAQTGRSTDRRIRPSTARTVRRGRRTTPASRGRDCESACPRPCADEEMSWRAPMRKSLADSSVRTGVSTHAFTDSIPVPDPQNHMASLPPASWNQIASWLKQIEALRFSRAVCARR